MVVVVIKVLQNNYQSIIPSRNYLIKGEYSKNGEELKRLSKFAIWIFPLENWTPFKTFHFFEKFTGRSRQLQFTF